MTANELILLLDIYRGADRKRHLGTMEKDLSSLMRQGLVMRKNYDGTLQGFNVTKKGDRLVKVLKEMSACLTSLL